MSGEAHIRIDEGIPRGPRIPHQPPAERQKQTGVYHAGKLQSLDINAVLVRYLNGETSSEIALTLGCTRQGLAFHLRRHAEEDWREAQIVLAIERKERAEEDLQGASDALSLARAREQLRSAQWDLERVFSRIFGPKQELTIELTGDLGERLRRARERVIEGETVSNTANAALLPVIQPEVNSE